MTAVGTLSEGLALLYQFSRTVTLLFLPRISEYRVNLRYPIRNLDRGTISLSRSMEKATNLNDAGNAMEVGSKGALVFSTDPLSMIVAFEQRRRDKSLEIT